MLIRIPTGPRGPNWPNKLATFLCGSNQEAAEVTGGAKATEQRKKKMRAYRVSTEAAMDCIRRLGAAAAGAFSDCCEANATEGFVWRRSPLKCESFN